MKRGEFLDKEKSLADAQRKALKVKWPCMCPKCTNKAINSHLLQRHGILSHVTVDNHLYEMTREDVFKWHENNPVRFKKVGLNNAISYPLFCDKHDTAIFLPIESGTIDFNDYNSQLLFSYRAVCAEIRKKEFILLETKSNESNIEEMSLDREALLIGENKGIKDLQYYKYLLEGEIKVHKGKFSFSHFSYPMLPIYSSASMSYEVFDPQKQREVKAAQKKKVWDALFIHIIPQPTSTEIIVGYHNNHTSKDMEDYVKSWGRLEVEELGYRLTDLFVAHVEDWGMSPQLYDRIPKDRFEVFFKLLAKYSIGEIGQKTNVVFNLFEGLL